MMSNEEWNQHRQPPRGPSDSPWATSDPSWQPPRYQDAPARDPRQPFGQPAAPAEGPTARIQDFQPPRQSKWRPALVIVAVLVVVGLLLAALQFFGPEGSGSSPTASPSAAAQDRATASPAPVATGGTSIPFEGNGTGTFEVLDQSWTDDGLSVRFRVTVDEGEQSFSVYIFNNASMQVADPLDIAPFYASSEQPHEATAVFPVERGPSTLVLASGFGRALTALPIDG